MSGSFRYANPPSIRWGDGTVREHLAAELDERGVRRAFVVTTKSVASNARLLPRVRELLGPRFAGSFDGIGEHAPIASIARAAQAAKESGADALVSLGGGSPIDAAKAVAFSLSTGLDFADAEAPARARKLRPTTTLPHVALPTTLSAAEMSAAAGFSAEGTREKIGVAASVLLPAAVLYDAELAVETPLPLWLSTGIRALDHAAEAMLAPETSPHTDALSLEAMRRLRTALPAAKSDPADRGARSEGQIAAWLSNSLPGPSSRGLSHTLGKRLGSRHGIPHGVTSCLLLPHALRAQAAASPTAAATIARMAEPLGARSPDAGSAAQAVQDLIAGLGLPQHLRDYGLTQAQLEEAARPLAKEWPLELLLSILHAAA